MASRLLSSAAGPSGNLLARTEIDMLHLFACFYFIFNTVVFVRSNDSLYLNAFISRGRLVCVCDFCVVLYSFYTFSPCSSRRKAVNSGRFSSRGSLQVCFAAWRLEIRWAYKIHWNPAVIKGTTVKQGWNGQLHNLVHVRDGTWARTRAGRHVL